MDTETRVINYRLSLCQDIDHYCPISSRDLNNHTSVCMPDAHTAEGHAYFVRIQATNEIGLSSIAESTRFVIDTTGPDAGDVIVSNPLGQKYPFVSSNIFAKWTGFDDGESGIKEYIVCVGTEPGLCNTVDETLVTNTSEYSWSGLNLTHQDEYFVHVKARNKAGLSTNFTSSDPIYVDKTGNYVI